MKYPEEYETKLEFLSDNKINRSTHFDPYQSLSLNRKNVHRYNVDFFETA